MFEKSTDSQASDSGVAGREGRTILGAQAKPLYSQMALSRKPCIYIYTQGVPGGKVNILGGHSIGHSKQKTLYEHVSYSERFPRYSHLTV